MLKKLFAILFLLQSMFVNANYKQVTINVYCFAKLYGYVKYFNPYKYSQEIDWQKFSIYGVSQVKSARNDSELIFVLNKLFKPISPDIIISKEVVNFIYTNEGEKGLSMTYWEHHGCGLDARRVFGLYKSPFTSKLQTNSSYPIDSIYNGSLINGINFSFKISTLVHNTQTNEFSKLKKEISKVKINQSKWANVKDYSNRVGSIVIAWNVIQHFYPYPDIDRNKWSETLFSSLEQIETDESYEGFYNCILSMLSNIPDGHIRMIESYSKGIVAFQKSSYVPKISTEFINDSLVILDFSGEYNSKLKKGDIITTVNNIPVKEYYETRKKFIPHSTEAGLKQEFSKRPFFCYKYDSVIVLNILRDKEFLKVEVKCNQVFAYNTLKVKTDFIKSINDSISLVNLSQVTGEGSGSLKEFKRALPLLQKKKHIIIDIRGYPKYFTAEILSYLTDKTIETPDLLMPIITQPDFKNVKFRNDKWSIKPNKIKLKANFYFLSKGNVSWGETVLDMIKHYKIGTIIGDTSTGVNGDITSISLPLLGFFFSGIKVTQSNGIELHGNGIAPDFQVAEYTNDIKNNKDVILEYAINLILKSPSNLGTTK